MTIKKFTYSCDICGNEFQHGPNRYEGHALKLYGNIFSCDSCWKGNHDGWAPHLEEILIRHLEGQGIAIPERNSKGLLPRN